MKSKNAGLRGIACLAYQENGMDAAKIKISLRSIETEDTTVISNAYGGGGHLNASAFVMDKSDFESTWKLDWQIDIQN